MMHRTPTTELIEDTRLPRPVGWGAGLLASIVIWMAILSAVGAL